MLKFVQCKTLVKPRLNFYPTRPSDESFRGYRYRARIFPKSAYLLLVQHHHVSFGIPAREDTASRLGWRFFCRVWVRGSQKTHTMQKKNNNKVNNKQCTFENRRNKQKQNALSSFCGCICENMRTSCSMRW